MENQIKKPSLVKYKNTMIPHILPYEAKAAGITKNDKEEWKELKKSITIRLTERHKKSSASVLYEDLLFKRSENTRKNHKHINKIKKEYEKVSLIKHHSDSEKYLQDKDIIDNLKYASSSAKEWICNKRAEILCKISKYEILLYKTFSQANIKSIPKMPFYINGRIFFTDLYVPKLKLAIEVIPVNSNNEKYKNQDKADFMYGIGITNLYLYRHEVANPEIIKILTEKYG